jgi:DNA-binding MarR family transcriptional regulator
LSSRAQLMAEIVLALREMRGRLLHVSQAIGEGVGLAPIEMEFVDLIAQLAPVTPGTLAARTGLRPATVTGILDRLEEEGWIRRERDAEDRRRVFILPELKRSSELSPRFAPMLTRLSALGKKYTVEELALVVGFLRSVSEAGEESVAELKARSS